LENQNALKYASLLYASHHQNHIAIKPVSLIIQRENSPPSSISMRPRRSLVDSRNGKKALTSLNVCDAVSLRSLWQGSVGSPEVNQWLHWLQFVRLQHVNLHGSKNEVAEATVHTLLEVEVVEWLDEVGPVQVSIDTEHLAEDGLADIVKLRGKTTALSNPVTLASKLRE